MLGLKCKYKFLKNKGGNKMATFSQYGVGGFSGGTIAADESYIGALGAFQMMEESAQNERAVFEFVLGCDFAEAATNNGVMTESEFEAINEASNGGIFSKVVDFFKRMIEKIKGILTVNGRMNMCVSQR